MQEQKGFTLIELLIVIAIIAIIAAIAIPALIHARISANESATIGDIRSVISAEVAYHSANQGDYGQLSCLALPSDAACVAGYASSAPTFLNPNMAMVPMIKSGYARAANYNGTGPEAGDVEAYCYQASPVTPSQSGVRSFGGDSSAVVAGTMQPTFACCAAGSLVAACSRIQ